MCDVHLIMTNLSKYVKYRDDKISNMSCIYTETILLPKEISSIV